MLSQTSLYISDITLLTKYSSSINLSNTKRPSYSQFINRDSLANKELINLELSLEPVTDTPNSTKIFKNEETNIWYRTPDGYELRYYLPDGNNQLLWSCVFNKEITKATVYCGEKIIRPSESGIEVDNPVSYPLDQLLLMYYLAGRNGALHHTAGIIYNNKSYLFLGKSGAGKSTISINFINNGSFRILSDDRVITRYKNDTFHAYGTPWPGEAGIARNENAPLGGIFFLKQSSENYIQEITSSKAFEQMLPVTSIPWYDECVFQNILDYLESLTLKIPTFDFHFTSDTESADFIHKFLDI